MTGKCEFCGQQKDLRLGGCFDCANAEAIIDEGLDMYDKGFDGDGIEFAAKTAGEKLKMLINDGWVKLTSAEKSKLNERH
jgi:hypothetical protein